MSTEPDRPWGSNFTPEEIAETRARKGLLSMELELSRECNLRCVYCYASSGKALHNELTREEIDGALDQAIALGARRIIVIGGGEPLLYPGVMDIMRGLRERGIIVDLFTNGTLITPEVARELFAMGISAVVKLNSMREEVQDALAAVPGTYRLIQQGLKNLMDAGYPSADAPLGVETIICRQNIDELPEMWIWARERGIVPYFEMITFQGRAKRQLDLNVSSEELRRVFYELSRIDRERYGLVWEPHPPIAALACNRHEYSCTLNAQGYIQPCVGVDMFIGNIRHAPLAEILATAPVMETMRKLRGNLKGACESCEQAQRVLRLPRAGLPRHRRLPGGRPALLAQPQADHLTRGARVPMPSFPLPIERLLPQRPPMLLLDRLLSCTASEGTADALISRRESLPPPRRHHPRRRPLRADGAGLRRRPGLPEPAGGKTRLHRLPGRDHPRGRARRGPGRRPARS